MRTGISLSLAIAAFLTACAPVAMPVADDRNTPQPPMTDTPSSNSAGKPPLIVRNPDGTFTIQKQPPKEDAKGAANKGLVIEPQVIVPEFPSREN